MAGQSLYQTFKRYRSLKSHRISALPIVILMPHSACNCRCIMCDIWKDNKNLKQLNEADVLKLIGSLKKLGTRQVVMSGGEALLNSKFFKLCQLLQEEKIRISLLSTGLTLQGNAEEITRSVHDIIISLDGDEETHNRIRNIPNAYGKTAAGIAAVRKASPGFRITGRSVIHRLNFRQWPNIIDSAKKLGLDQISFLPADISSQAFNREIAWGIERQAEIALSEIELDELQHIIELLKIRYATDFATGFIAESPEKIQKIHTYYAAFFGKNSFPEKKCNAPWVSAVIEADGNVRPCFFHAPIGNIREENFEQIINGEKAYQFRKTLDMDSDPVCKKCVCYLNLPPGRNPGTN